MSSATRSASRSAASVDAARRTGAPFSPVNEVSGGSHSANVTRRAGESSSVTATHLEAGEPSGRDSGSATVAEARTNVGSAP